MENGKLHENYSSFKVFFLLLLSLQVQALMGNLLRLRCEDSSIKCLVVSQFTRFLTILETPLR